MRVPDIPQGCRHGRCASAGKSRAHVSKVKRRETRWGWGNTMMGLFLDLLSVRYQWDGQLKMPSRLLEI